MGEKQGKGVHAVRRSSWLLALPALAFLGAFFYAPFIILVWSSLVHEGSFTLRAYIDVVTSPAYLRVTYYSALIAVTTTLVTLLLSYPAARYIAFYASPKERGVLLAALIAPFWIDFLLRAYSLRVLVEAYNNVLAPLTGWRLRPGFTTLIAGMIYDYLPYMLLPIYAGLSKVPRNVLDAASTLGASGLKRLYTVEIPLAMPGIIAGIMLVSLMSFTEFVIPALLGGVKGYTVGYLIYDLFLKYRDSWHGSALTLVITATTVVVAAIVVRKLGEEVVLG